MAAKQGRLQKALDLPTEARSRMTSPGRTSVCIRLNFWPASKLTPVKSLRVWLILLLAVLLPVRGALALAMQCSTPGTQVQVQAQLSGGHEHHAASLGHEHHHGAAADPAVSHDDSDGTGHDHAGAADKCNLCAASCSATALVSASMTVAEQQSVSAVFPHLYAPPPSFVSDGLKRPPRSI